MTLGSGTGRYGGWRALEGSNTRIPRVGTRGSDPFFEETDRLGEGLWAFLALRTRFDL